jgi:predicted transcriptional regulator
MACVNPDGTLMPSAVAILNALKIKHTAEELSEIVLQPLFKIRSGLRDMVEANLVEFKNDKYIITDFGLQKLKS